MTNKLTAESIKAEAIAHLTQWKEMDYVIPNTNALWGETKTWAKRKGWEMGGGYASHGSSISVRVLTGENVETDLYSFDIELSEVQ